MYVAECLDHDRARTRALWMDGFRPTFEYDVRDTPCMEVTTGETCLYSHNVRQYFPHIELLAQLNAESFLGVPLWDSSRRVIGHMVLVDDKPMAEDPLWISVLQTFAARAGVGLNGNRRKRNSATRSPRWSLEVSQYLVGDLRAGDQFELRGPIGGYFVWTTAAGGPLCLIAGGSGVAPLMAMLRHRDRSNNRVPVLLLYSSRTLEDIIYRAELDAIAHRDGALRVVNTLTREKPERWMGHRGRIDKVLLAAECFPPQQNPRIFVCGSTPLVEDVSRFLVELGHDPLKIKTERFGPTGGQAL